MTESTLAPTPSFNPNIPIVTIGGGKKHSYNDPNSPESILKKVATLQVQTAADTKYDVARSPYHKEEAEAEAEPFTNQISSPDIIRTLLGFIVLIFILLVVFKKLKILAKIFLLGLAVLFTILVIHVYVRNVNDI